MEGKRVSRIPSHLVETEKPQQQGNFNSFKKRERSMRKTSARHEEIYEDGRNDLINERITYDEKVRAREQTE